MSAPASQPVHARSARSEQPPIILTHKIPSAKSEPYICMEGPDRALWFCESGASKIGRFDPADASFREFALPVDNAMPIGITVGGDGNMWFSETELSRIGRITPDAMVGEYAIPVPGAGARCISPMANGRMYVTLFDAGMIGEVIPQ